MALQIWLPLDGDLRNQGLTNVTVNNNGATIDNNGKIGKCYSFNGSSSIDTGYKESIGTGDFSISAWIYITQTSGKTYQCIVGNKGTGAASVGFAIYWNQNQKKFLWSTADGSSATEIWSTDTFDTIIYNSWHHIIMCRNNNDTRKGYFYLDGIRKEIASIPVIRNITSTTSIKIGSVTPAAAAYYFTGKINDIRIYDHALSAKEAKELSKGLILHYRLSKPMPNLMPNSFSMPYGSSNAATGTWRNAGSSSMTKSRVDLGNGNYCFQNSGIQTSNDGSCWGIDSFPLAANTQFTISCEARLTDGTEGYAGFNVYASTPNGGYDKLDKNYYVTSLTKSWKTCYLVFTTNSNTTRNIYVGATTGSTSATIQIKNIKIEIGDHPTAWIPNETDTLYSAMGYDSNIELDCAPAGNQNDGTIVGTITAAADSPRYEASYQFANSDGAIKIGNLSTICPEKIFTFNIWFKKETGKWSSKNWETILGGPSGFELEGRVGTTPYIHPYSWGGGSTSTANSYSIAYTLDEWHMLTMVRTISDTKFYLDGELKVTGSAGNIPSGDYFIGSWRDAISQNFRGYLSDARLYCTALSSSDIAELYQTAAQVDKDGNVYAYEFKEA